MAITSQLTVLNIILFRGVINEYENTIQNLIGTYKTTSSIVSDCCIMLMKR